MTPTTRYRIFIGVAVVLVLLAAFCLLNRPESSSATQSTDDAYVQADFTAVVPQVAGVITELAVNDHQQVKAGDPLVNIDDRKLHIAVDIANAAIDSLQARLEQQRSTISQARAAVAAARSNLKLAETNRSRFANLARDGSGTVQAQQQAEAEWETRRASLDRERAGLQAADRQIAVLQADLKKAKAAKADADLNLSHAHVTAPVGGIVDQRRARVGGYARVGEPLLTLVPLDAVYIEANFRETQLARMRVGQPADITVDALPGVKLKGRVESLAPASGVSYSAVPAHNATGNFTKITQRLPIRIQIEPNQKDAKLLRVGMSAHPSIQVKE